MRSLNLTSSSAPLRVLCLGAHSDDIEIGCGGTILNWVERGVRLDIRWVVLSAPGLRAKEASQSAEAFLKGDKGAVKTSDQDWQSLEELAAAAGTEPGPRQFLVRRLKNFKAVRDSGEISFTPLTVFIGNNGSGKSSVIELQAFGRGSLGTTG